MGWLDEAVRASRLPSPDRFPRELADEVEIYLPVSLVHLPKLSSHQMRDWLAHKNIHISVPAQDRRIHGCMVAQRERAFIFCDAGDHMDVRRFTLAHEVAHFVLDHLLHDIQSAHELPRRSKLLRHQLQNHPHQISNQIYKIYLIHRIYKTYQMPQIRHPQI